MRIEHIDPEPMHRIAYRNARSGGGTESSVLEILTAKASGLGECEAILVASDLQGIATSIEARGSLLLGEVLEEHVAILAEEGQLPPPSRMGVILAGDLYSVPGANKRGGFGDVSSVWAAFAHAARWVVGVVGNHDDFGEGADILTAGKEVHLLDGDVVTVDGISFGGVGQIIGNSRKPGKRSEADQLGRLDRVLSASPDVLVLHEGPGGGPNQFGNLAIGDLLEVADTRLTICGHRHWDQPLAEVNGKQILNVDARVVVLT